MLIVDAHVHLWSAERLQQLRWMTPSSLLNQARTLKDYAIESPTQLAIFIECDVHERPDYGYDYALIEIKEAIKYAQESEAVKIGAIIAWAPLLASQEDLEQYLVKVEECSTDLPIVRGFRYLLQQKPREVSRSAQLRSNFVYLQSRWPRCVFELGIDVHHDGCAVLEDVLALVEAAPALTFVVDHLAKADVTQSEIPLAYKLGMQALANHQNVHVKVSGCLTEVKMEDSFDTVLEQSSIVAYFDFLLQTFGKDRLIWASDWPVCTLSPIRSESLVQKWFDYCRSHLNPPEIFGANAARIYHLTETQSCDEA